MFIVINKDFLESKQVDLACSIIQLMKNLIELDLLSPHKEKDFLDEIRVKNCNLKVLLSHPCLEEEI